MYEVLSCSIPFGFVVVVVVAMACTVYTTVSLGNLINGKAGQVRTVSPTPGILNPETSLSQLLQT
jgi:hypothetical protein